MVLQLLWQLIQDLLGNSCVKWVKEFIYLWKQTNKNPKFQLLAGCLFLWFSQTFSDFDLQQLSVPAHPMRQTAAVQRKKGEQVLWHNTLCSTELQLHLELCTWSDKNHTVGLPPAPSVLQHLLGLESNGPRICSVTISPVCSNYFKKCFTFESWTAFPIFFLSQ